MKLADCTQGHDTRVTTRLWHGRPYCIQCRNWMLDRTPTEKPPTKQPYVASPAYARRLLNERFKEDRPTTFKRY